MMMKLSLLQFIVFITLITGASTSSAASLIRTLPGYPGPLPFKLETGYIGVGDDNDIQLFYYFIESENDPENDPLIMWNTGGPGCSGFSGLVYEMGPLKFDGISTFLKRNPYSWTKAASIIFIDSPVGTGFSYSTTCTQYIMTESKCTQHNYSFLRKWLLNHPEFIKNRLFIAGDSFGGKIATMLALQVAEGNEAGLEPRMLLQGYFIGNSVTEMDMDYNERVPFAHRMGLISDEYYKMAKKNCRGRYTNPDPKNKLCNEALQLVNMCTKDVRLPHILEAKCFSSSSEHEDDAHLNLIRLPNQNEPRCRDDTYVTSAIWANSETVRESLRIRKGTKGMWERCIRNLPFEHDVRNVFNYYKLLNKKGIHSLFYSGDHDMIIPYLATLKTTRALNFSLHEPWRPWKLDLQVAGYTEKYKNNEAYVIFASIKGGGHTAPEYKPKECLEMMRRFISGCPL